MVEENIRKNVRGSLPRRTKEEQRKLTDLIDRSWAYLDANFHKFDQKTKINIALEIVKKAIPQKLEHGLDNELAQYLKQSDTNRLREVICQLNSIN